MVLRDDLGLLGLSRNCALGLASETLRLGGAGLGRRGGGLWLWLGLWVGLRLGLRLRLGLGLGLRLRLGFRLGLGLRLGLRLGGVGLRLRGGVGSPVDTTGAELDDVVLLVPLSVHIVASRSRRDVIYTNYQHKVIIILRTNAP